MKAYFNYLKEVVTAFFKDLGLFFKTAIVSPWYPVKNNFEGYNSILRGYKSDFHFGGWFFYILFMILLVVFIAGVILLLYFLIRKYIRFVKKELDKEELKNQVERLNFELFNAIQEKDKILNLKVGYMGLSDPSTMKENKDTVEAISSRFPKLTTVDQMYRGKDLEIPVMSGLSLEELCNTFRHFAASQLHLYYKIGTIRQLFASMGTTKLLILEGISGTGKTSLPYALGKFFSFDANIVPVQPNWKDRSELLGYYNEFTKKFNESEFLKALYQSTYRKDLNIIVLDEMNLARIEYYFAEFLSIMELPNVNDWKVELITSSDENDPDNLKDGKVLIPQNAIFFGTANNDDSTFTISDKVYDRAMSLFFDDKGIPFESEPQNPISIPYSQIEQLYKDAQIQYPVSEKILEKFDQLDRFVIKKFKLAFGNRILKQMSIFVPNFVACGGSELDGVDFIFTNKILKKFQSLNIAFLKDELKELDTQLDKLFGKGTFPMAHTFIDNLLKMN